MPKTTFHALSPKQALDELQSRHEGLPEAEAEQRLKQYGQNKLKEKKHTTPLQMFLGQFADFLIIILIIAAIVSGFLGETLDATFIIIIVVLNAILGFVQEYRAEKAIEALKNMVAPQARVIRDGVEKKIAATQLVPGDVVILDEGDKIPADCRLIEAINFDTQEASLTGESLPVHKQAAAVLDASAIIAERTNMAFMGTIAVRGRAKAIVTSTGMNTEIGLIATMVQEAGDEETPLQKRLAVLGKQLGVGALAACAIIFVLGVLRGENILETFLIAVSLAVAAVPEGLPAIVTITLAIGVQRMVKRNAIIRKLPAVETLGSTTIICSDKTGTLTKNEMTVRRIYANAGFVEVSGSGYEVRGEFTQVNKCLQPPSDPHLNALLRVCALCNNAGIVVDSANKKASILGDPTEAALLVLAAKAGIDYSKLKNENTLVAELSFDSDRKMMSTVRQTREGKTAFVKGALESILSKSAYVLLNGREVPLAAEHRKAFEKANAEMAGNALRVLAMAYKRVPESMKKYSLDSIEKDLVIVGLVGMIDPPRPEAKKAVAECEQAGIKVVMITGDNEATAAAIARDLGILKPTQKVLTGALLEKMSEKELADIVQQVTVYARVSPEHKIKIVSALKARGEIVAMTGDGVNDAPALKKADIGVAMGITGTDVAKEASAMVLMDDNFASIVNAVEEGRTIYANIAKSVRYLVSCNIGEVFTILFATLAGLPNPLTPIQILWMNLVTDSLPALALGVDPAEKDVMSRSPRDPKESILNKRTLVYILTIGLFVCIGTLALYVFYLQSQLSAGKTLAEAEAYARTVAFTTIIFFQMFVAIDVRSFNRSVLEFGLFTNKKLLGAIAIAVGLQIAITYVPFFHQLFGTAYLAPLDWVIITLVSMSVLVLSETRKKISP
ncbi:calcium-transporting P-type ATPase, PMR1-type [Candidatus Micrarchaeota archaeon]|nr:calcium-transporting P-type ATPase, PMR1-type [Candidatus Micrarchaeota archaeon]